MTPRLEPELIKSQNTIESPEKPERGIKIVDLLERIRAAAQIRWQKQGKRGPLPYNVRVDNDGKIMKLFQHASVNNIHPHPGHVYRLTRSKGLSEIIAVCTKIPNTLLRISIGDALQRIVTMIESGELDKRSDVKTTTLITNQSGLEQYRITVDHTPKYFAVYITNTIGHFIFPEGDGILLMENPPIDEK